MEGICSLLCSKTILTQGENVSTMEVANAISTYPGVQEVCVYGIKIPGGFYDGICRKNIDNLQAKLVLPQSSWSQKPLKSQDFMNGPKKSLRDMPYRDLFE